MIQYKVCLLGAYAVGKTSLVSRFVHSIFSNKYHTTLGVKIDRKVVAQPDGEVALLVWDLAGEDKFHRVDAAYTRGAAGLVLVADGCRAETLRMALELGDRARAVAGDVPRVLAVNKADRLDEWEVQEEDLATAASHHIAVFRTSALLDDGVQGVFQGLARLITESRTT